MLASLLQVHLAYLNTAAPFSEPGSICILAKFAPNPLRFRGVGFSTPTPFYSITASSLEPTCRACGVYGVSSSIAKPCPLLAFFKHLKADLRLTNLCSWTDSGNRKTVLIRPKWSL